MKAQILDVFAIPDDIEGRKVLWPKIGIAFVNKDDSINVILDAFPRVGKIQIRARKPKTETQQTGDN